jgi:hypothetical protein
MLTIFSDKPYGGSGEKQKGHQQVSAKYRIRNRNTMKPPLFEANRRFST